MLQLPKYYLITPEPLNHALFLKRLQQCLQQGIKLVLLRAKSVPYLYYSTLAIKVMHLCEEYQALLILDREVRDLPQTGLHLSSMELMANSPHPGVLGRGNYKLLSAACHNAAELLQAQQLGVDLVTLSPVLPTYSHPETAPLGWDKFAELAKMVNIPVFALGGLNKEQLALAQRYGAYGIAAIRGLWGD